MHPQLKRILLSGIVIPTAIAALAQSAKAPVSFGRSSDSPMPPAAKATAIVSKINADDADKRSKLSLVLAAHFDSLYAVFAQRKAAMNSALVQAPGNKELADARSKAAWDAATGKLNKLQATFLGKLSSLLTNGEIETIKDEMTERLLRAEYGRFLELLPDLKEQHKTQVMAYLVEARENAMCAETADMRKQWFIKYRGRANNFLAAAGYDLRKATEALEKRKSASTKDH